MDTKDYFYLMKSYGNTNIPWELRGYSDADYAKDNDTQKSVTGYIVLNNGAVITFHSQIQKTVTLSVTEAEYSSIMKVYFKILFFHVILLFIGVVVEYPISVTLELYYYQRTH